MLERPSKDYTDEELIVEFQKSDDIDAFQALVGRYKDQLYNFVFRYLNERDSAEDVVQETMIRVYRKKNSYKPVAKFSTWVYTIAGNLAKSELKKRKVRSAVSIDRRDEDYAPLEIADDGPSPDELADAGIVEEEIQAALMKIKPVYREAVILRDVEQLSYEEIAVASGQEIGTVKSRINRGRAALKELLKDVYQE
ncbi:MAG: sigma-70 family RNA polymerase sigma factor [Ignavibacteriales bacterium]|nr:sigma-70 family RNA polymerase sigma factor [Ignavibacteriales bacterium]